MDWQVTPQLRWVRKEHPHGGYDVVLEQLWENPQGGQEWRPVPGPD